MGRLGAFLIILALSSAGGGGLLLLLLLPGFLGAGGFRSVCSSFPFPTDGDIQFLLSE